MSTPTASTRSMRIPISLDGRSKLQTDAIRMGLLLAYGSRRLQLAPDGSSVLVELQGSQRSIEVHELVDELAARFPG